MIPLSSIAASNTVNDTPLLEDALRAYLNRRCRRAYAHDLRNGLQGIFGGVDALIRTVRATKPMHMPVDQLVQFVQQAITNHERGLEQVLESMAPEQLTPTRLSLREMLSGLTRFLTNDVARNNIRVRLDFADDLNVTLVPARLRLIMLGLLTEGIDSMSGTGGELRLAGRTSAGRVRIDIVTSRGQPQSPSFVADAVQRLVTELSGRLARQAGDQDGHEVRLELPAT